MSAVLQAWSGYVDALDDDSVWLMLADETNPSDEREYGEFPRRLFRHMEDVIGLGTFVTVEITDTPEVCINPVLLTDEEIEKSKANVEELLTALGKLRE